MNGPILYTAEVDYPPEAHETFSAWYANRHAPDLIRSGFRTATSYRAVVGGLAVLNVYEVPDTGVFAGALYKGVLPNDPYGAEVRGTSAGKPRAQTAYLERASHGETGPMDADWISLFRFALPESKDDEVLDFLSKINLPGVKRIRYGTRTSEKIGAGTHRPRCMILAEWKARPPESADLLAPLARRFGAALTDAEPYVGKRAYPWPDVR